MKKVEKRTCSIIRPYLYFILEVVSLLLIAYIFSMGNVYSAVWFVTLAVGLVYPVGKLPRYVSRAIECNRYKKSTEGLHRS
ncbi:hypothetical protein [Sulfurimonas sp. HSL3-7]|uniref:hypothetical protein n=1 Tax=Sulfonitrofixus jiaomeiensis TaxID=3131938 RepID=UPI0031F766ED